MFRKPKEESLTSIDQTLKEILSVLRTSSNPHLTPQQEFVQTRLRYNARVGMEHLDRLQVHLDHLRRVLAQTLDQINPQVVEEQIRACTEETQLVREQLSNIVHATHQLPSTPGSLGDFSSSNTNPQP